MKQQSFFHVKLYFS